jgi:hypothetical protein
MNIFITSAACCYPGLAVFDEQAKRVVEQAVKETGMQAEVRIIPAATAVYGGILPKHLLNELMGRMSRNETGPVVLINGEAVAFGVPRLDDMKAILQKFRATETIKEK